ncbi:MAG: PKD domain-containing protein, partial [Chloroflexi bacterium]|nr:PKD domain-containing protein [Chloroflexota bacterium]
TTPTSKPGYYVFVGSLYNGDTWINDRGTGEFLLDVDASDLSTFTVNLSLKNPNGDIVHEETQTSLVLPEETRAVSLSYPSPSMLGIWTLEVKILDYKGELLHSGAQRFAVSNYAANPDGWTYQGSDFSLGLSSEKEHYYRGEEAPFTITVWNHGDTDEEVTSWFRVGHHYDRTNDPIYGASRVWGPGSGNPLHWTFTVPAGESVTLEHTVPLRWMDRANAQIFRGDETSGDRIGWARRSFFVDATPSIDLTVSTDKQEYYKEEDASVSLNIKNRRSTAADLDTTVTVLNQQNNIVFEDAFNVALEGNGSHSETYIVPLPTSYPAGAYTVRVQVFGGNNRVGSGSTYFALEERYQISMVLDRVERVYIARDPITLDVVGTNLTTTYDSFQVDISCPSLGLADSPVFNVDPGASQTVTYNLSIPANILPGQHEIFVAIPTDGLEDQKGFYVPESELTLDIADTTYSAGGIIPITLSNIGGVDTTGICSIDLAEWQGAAIQQTSGSQIVLAGQDAQLQLDIPGQAASGEYLLTVRCTDQNTGGMATLSEFITIDGLEAALAVTTDKPAYFSDETITIDASITNLDGEITNGLLNLQVFATVPMDALGLDDLSGDAGVLWHESGTATAIPAGDLDGDGSDDALVISIKMDPSGYFYTSWVTAVSGYDAEPLWERNGWEGQPNVTPFTTVANSVGDLDGNGTADVVLTSLGMGMDPSTGGVEYLNRRMAVSGINGQILWVTTEVIDDMMTSFAGPGGPMKPAGDLDGDGKQDILVSDLVVDMNTNELTSIVTAIRGYNGEQLWQKSGSGMGANFWLTPLSLVLMDLLENNPGGMDWMMHQMLLMSALTYSVDTSPAFAMGDVNTDGKDDVMFFFLTDDMFSPSSMGYELMAVNGQDGQIIWQESAEGYDMALARTSGDLSSDGREDVLLFTMSLDAAMGYMTKVRALSGHDGQDLWQRTTSPDPLGAQGLLMLIAESARPAGDFDGDGTPDVLVTSIGIDPNTWMLVTIASAVDGLSGQPLWEVTIPDSSNGYLNDSAKPAGDLDGDGRDDVLAWGMRTDLSTGESLLEVTALSGYNGEQLWQEFRSLLPEEVQPLQQLLMWSLLMGLDSDVPGGLRQALAAADLDADGKDDVIMAGKTDLSVLRGDDARESWWIESANPFIIALPSGREIIERKLAQWPDFNANGSGDLLITTTEGFYALTSPYQGMLVWEQDIPVDLVTSSGTVDLATSLDIPAEIPGISGRLSLASTFYSELGQVLSRSNVHPFFIGDHDTSLVLKTDKDTYQPNETVNITGVVSNGADVATGDLNLVIMKDGEVIFSDTFALDPGASHSFATNTTSSEESFILEGTVDELNVSNVITVRYPVAAIAVEATIPQVVTMDPFDVSVLMQNTGEKAVTLNVAIEGQISNIIVPEGESARVDATLNITEDTIVDVIITGDVEKKIHKLVVMGEQADIEVTQQGFYFEGLTEIPISIENTLTFSSPFEEETVTLYVNQPNLEISEFPTNLNLALGEETTWTFKIRNTGSIEAEANLHLMLPDFEDSDYTWVMPGEEEEISFTILVPDDLESKRYTARYELNGTPGEFTYYVQGANISVETSLDKDPMPFYTEGETAILTLNITNDSAFDLGLYARVQLNEYEEVTQPFVLSPTGTQTLQFNVPVSFTGSKLFYGIYMDSGRSLHLNALYVYEMDQTRGVMLGTDKQVYEIGEAGSLFYTAFQDGTLSIESPVYSGQLQLTAGDSNTLPFTVPDLSSGTYYIEYTFNDETYMHPFDVNGYSAKVLEFTLDKDRYISSETMQIYANIEANRHFDGFLRMFVYDYTQQTVIDEFDVPVSFLEGQNRIETSRIITANTKGIYAIYYSVYADLGVQELALASGALTVSKSAQPQSEVNVTSDPNGLVSMWVDEAKQSAMENIEALTDTIQAIIESAANGTVPTVTTEAELLTRTLTAAVSAGPLLLASGAEYFNAAPWPNSPPIANAGGPYIAEEGSSVTFDASGSSDLDEDLLEYRWDFESDGTWDTDWSIFPITWNTWDDDHNSIVTLEVRDGESSSTATTNITVENVSPSVYTGSDQTLDEIVPVTISGFFSDSGRLDIHSAEIDWGDSTVEPVLVEEEDGFGTVTGSHEYTANGVYTVVLSITDDDGGIGSDSIAVTLGSTGPTAGFTWLPVSQNEGLAIQFTDTSTPPDQLVNWDWDFGGSGTSSAQNTSFVFMDDGQYDVCLTVTDTSGMTDTICQMVTINDMAPNTAFTWTPELPAEGSEIQFVDASLSAADDILAWDWDFGASGMSSAQNPTLTFMDDGVYSICLVVTDDDGSTNELCQDVTVTDLAPTAAFSWSPEPRDEGSPVQFTDSSTSSPDELATWNWDFGGIGTSTEQNPIFTFVDDGVYDVALTVTDDDVSPDTIASSGIITNVAPLIGTITVPVDPVQAGTPVSASADFTDVGLLDTHTATWDWDDGITSSGTVTFTNGVGSVTGKHTYLEAGVYTVKLMVEDDDGGTANSELRYVVIYDPDGGFVTGGGWINSPEGAFVADTTLTGKANFGFVSKYKKGQSTPSGNTQFQFRAGDLNFHSDNYEWLVIAGHRAMYKGTGTINGDGNYGFMISAIDEKLTPSTDVDLFRIKIWDKDNDDAIVYDNLIEADEDADPTTPIQGGNIVIHKSK